MRPLGSYATLALGAMLLLLIGCDKKETAKVPDSTNLSTVLTPSSMDGVSTQNQDVKAAVTVQLLPEQPRAVDSIRVRVVGVSGSELLYRWSIDGVPVDGESDATLKSGSLRRGNRVDVRVAFDGREVGSSVVVGNSPPRIKAVPFVPTTVFHGVDISLFPDSEDPDGDEVSYRYTWFVNGDEVAGNDAPNLAGERFRRGDHISISIIPNDGHEDGEPFLSSEILIPNGPPTFVSTPPVSFKGQLFSYQAKAVDPDGDVIFYVLEEGPQGMTINGASGLVTWNYKDSDAGEHKIRIIARDTENEWEAQNFVLNITLPEGGK